MITKFLRFNHDEHWFIIKEPYIACFVIDSCFDIIEVIEPFIDCFFIVLIIAHDYLSMLISKIKFRNFE